MKRLFLWTVLGVTALAPAAFADIADYMLNVNGTTYCPGGGEAGLPALCSSLGGLAAAGASGTLNTTFPGGTGLGTTTLVFNPGAPGSYFVNFWLFENVDTITPQDEWGNSHNGPAPAGETWQIDVPDVDYGGELGVVGAGTIVSHTKTNALNNTNFVPGKGSNNLFQCPFGMSTCDDFTSMALGFGFTLGAGQQATVSFTVQQTAPAGFYLSQTDPNNGVTDFFSGNVVIGPAGGGGGVPEPGSWILLGTVAGVLGLLYRRRLAAQ